MISSRCFCASLLLFSAVLPVRAYEPEKKVVVPELPDAEVRAHLQGGELADWEKLDRDQGDAERQLNRAKELAKGRKMEFVGAAPSVDRKAEAEALGKAAEERLRSIAKSRETLRSGVVDRIRKAATVVSCPVLPLRDAVTAGVADIVAFAGKSGYAHVRSLGFIVASSRNQVRDVAWSELLDETVKAAQGEAPAGGGEVAVVLGELQPADALGGAVVSLRLIDAKAMTVRHATLALVPADSGKPGRSNSEEVETRIAVLEDWANFFPKLGKVEDWPFEVEDSGAGGLLLKTVLVARGKPLLADSAAIRLVTDNRAGRTSVPKAYWVITPEPGVPGAWRVASRLASPGAKALPVGLLRVGARPPVKDAR